MLQSFTSRSVFALALSMLPLAGSSLRAQSTPPPVNVVTGGDPQPPLAVSGGPLNLAVVALTLLQMI